MTEKENPKNENVSIQEAFDEILKLNNNALNYIRNSQDRVKSAQKFIDGEEMVNSVTYGKIRNDLMFTRQVNYLVNQLTFKMSKILQSKLKGSSSEENWLSEIRMRGQEAADQNIKMSRIASIIYDWYDTNIPSTFGNK
jgi:hypothetical protein